MSLTRSIARNVFFKGVGELLVRLLSFAFVVLVARTLRAEDFGALNFAYSFPLLFIVLTDFGFSPLLIREVSRHPEQSGRVFSNLLFLKILFSLAYLAAVLIGLQVLAPSPAFRQAALFLTGFMLLNSFTDFFNAVFQAHQQMQLEAGVMAWQKVSLLGFGLLALALGKGLAGVAGAYLAAGICGLTAAVWVLARRGFAAGAWRIDKSYLGHALLQALPLTLTALFVNLYFRIDMTILAKLRPAAEVGWYGAAHKCIEVMMLVPAVLVTSAFPSFSRLFLEDRERLQRAAHWLLKWLLLLALPMAAGAFLAGTPLMVLIFGSAFAPAGKAFSWLTLALGFIFLNYPLSYLLISGNRQRVNAVGSGLAAAVSLAANFLLIPRFGYQGAAVSAAVTEGFLFTVYFVVVNRKLFPIRLGLPLLRIAAATGLMAVPVWWLRHRQPLLPLAAGALTYAVAICLVGAVGREDWELLRKLRPGKMRLTGQGEIMPE